MKGSNDCVHNKMIECAGEYRPCHKCGWNPEIHEKRLKSLCAKNPKLTGLKI